MTVASILNPLKNCWFSIGTKMPGVILLNQHASILVFVYWNFISSYYCMTNNYRSV